ncbi:MAG: DegV family protein [Oscillospiraceae bacterium]|nr:DegV family protein [Oscillospiraceae bacterium]
MSDYVILTDSSCDLPPELERELDLAVLPLTVEIEGKRYRNFLDGREIDPKEFYNKIRAGSQATTAAVNVGEWSDVMEPLLAEGKDLLVLAFSSGLSTTCNSAMIAAADLREQYPDRKIYVVDTLCASMGQGLLVYLACKRKEKGGSLEEVRDWVEQNKLHLCHWFTVDDLNHLKRGGRVSAATALVGTMLNIKPVLHVDDEGHLINMSKARGRQASLKALVEKAAETAIDPASQVMFLSHGDCLEEAGQVAQMVKDKLGVKEVVISYVGPVIGAHTGPGVIAFFFLGTQR